MEATAVTAQRTSPKTILVTRVSDGATFTITGKATCAKPIVVAWVREYQGRDLFVAQTAITPKAAAARVQAMRLNSYDSQFVTVEVA